MKLYKMSDLIYFAKNKRVPLVNEKEEEVGYITKDNVPGYEKNHVFTYTSLDEQVKVTVGIKKAGISRLLMARYGIITGNDTFELKDKLGNNILYFCVTGEIDDQKVLFEENWDGNIELKLNKEKVGLIKQKQYELIANFQFTEQIKENSLMFAVTVLMFFMWKIYKDESEIIEALLLE